MGQKKIYKVPAEKRSKIVLFLLSIVYLINNPKLRVFIQNLFNFLTNLWQAQLNGCSAKLSMVTSELGLALESLGACVSWDAEKIKYDVVLESCLPPTWAQHFALRKRIWIFTGQLAFFKRAKIELLGFLNVYLWN